MSEDITALHGVVSRVIDVPSQQVSYVRIEFPIEFHASITTAFYGRRVIVALAGPETQGSPYGPIVRIEPAPDPPPPPKEKKALRLKSEYTKKIVTDAAIICQDPQFIAFAWQHMNPGAIQPDHFGEGEAADFMRTFCGVESRRDLATDPTAELAFKRLMTLYRDWTSL